MDAVLAVLPHWSFGPWEIAGPLKIHSFGLCVAIGLILCFTASAKRAEKKLNMPGEEIQNLGFYLVAIGWALSHVFNVLMYEPEEVIRDPLVLFKFWGSISSYGGLMGGFIAFYIWHWRHKQYDRLTVQDHAAWSLAIPWFFGRIGCATVHDHPGSIARNWEFWDKVREIIPSLPEIFPLAINFDPEKSKLAGIRHDLGFYEAIWWAAIVAAMYWLDRKPRPRGFYLAVLPILYAPARFTLDFMRVPPELGGDARYMGLTPAQYLSLLVFMGGLIYLPIVLRRPPLEWVEYKHPSAQGTATKVDDDEDDEEDDSSEEGGDEDKQKAPRKRMRRKD